MVKPIRFQRHSCFKALSKCEYAHMSIKSAMSVNRALTRTLRDENASKEDMKTLLSLMFDRLAEAKSELEEVLEMDDC